jgi:integrase
LIVIRIQEVRENRHSNLIKQKHARKDIRKAVVLARYTGQRQADVLRMGPQDVEDGGLNVRQQKTGKQLWVALHCDLVAAMAGWEGTPSFRRPRERALPQSASAPPGHAS